LRLNLVRRSRRRVIEGAAVASVLSGLPSTVLAGEAPIAYVLDATSRVGVLVPPFRRGLVRGALAHVAISAAAAEVLARTLPRRRSVVWGALAGLLMGVVNVGIIGRRIPAIAELPLGPQLADNVAFGVVFAAVADRVVKGYGNGCTSL
jgi:hypothetical protein